MSTISPSLQIGGVNGWKGKEGAVLGWQQTSGGLFKPAKFDFTRLSGSASYVDENGLIQIEHRPNYPRFTYQDGKQCLMNEEARTNLVTYSEQFNNAAWFKTTGGAGGSAPTITANDAVAPDGETTADKLTINGAQNRIERAITVSSGADVAETLFVKKTGAGTSYDYIRLLCFDGSGDGFRAWFNITDGTIGTNNGFGTGVLNYARITEFGDYYRIEISGNISGTSSYEFFFTIADGDASNNSPLSAEAHIWGAQLEEGSYASSYIPTEGSAVTRAAESIEGLNLGNFLGDSQGGLYVEALAFDVSASPQMSISSGGINERQLTGIFNGQFLFNSRTNNIVQCNIISGSISNNVFFKEFIAYAENDFALYADGSQIGTDTSGTTSARSASLNQFQFDNSTSGSLFRGLIHELRVYDQRPANSQMETQTT